MYTTTPLGLCVKTVQKVKRSHAYKRYRLESRLGCNFPDASQNGSNCKMSEELATEVNNALFEGGSDYRWVLVEGGE